jgi:hypothetical protein
MIKVQNTMTQEIPATKLTCTSSGDSAGYLGFGAFLGHWSLVIGPNQFVPPSPRP